MSCNRKFSVIWNHFSENGLQQAMCKYCKKTLSMSGGSQSNLKRHLKSMHPLVSITIERQEVTLGSAELNAEGASTSSRNNQPQQQQSIAQFLRRPPPIRKSERIDKQLLKMIAKGHHALRIVEEPEFRKLIQEVSECPGYTLPSRKSVSNNLLPSTHMEILGNIKTEVRSAFAVCLTTDGWTSRTNTSFVAITAHYIDDNAILKSYLLSCEEFSARHTGENLCNFIKNIISEFEIQNKVTAIVSDNAANITLAINLGGWRHIGCFAHTLNLVVQAAIKEIGDIVTKVKKIVEYFHKSAQGLKKLRETQKQMSLPDLKLKQDVVTRWNSTYEMLRRIFEIKDAVISTLSLNKPEIGLSLEEWEIIKEVIPILEPFYEVTMEISGEKNVTLSKVTVLTNILERFISKCDSTKPNILQMIRTMQKEITMRFGNIERNSLYAESTILDPRFKRKGFKNDTSYDDAVRVLRNRICCIRLPNDEAIVVTSATPSSTNTTRAFSIWKEYDTDMTATKRPENHKAATIREFDKYLNEEYLDRTEDPLVWWKERRFLYPHIYMYAMKRLCIVATSVPCERIFSATGQIINERRSLLKPNKVSSLVFLHNNM